MIFNLIAYWEVFKKWKGLKVDSQYNIGRLAVILIAVLGILAILVQIFLYKDGSIDGATFAVTFFSLFLSLALTQLMVAVFDIADNTRQILSELKNTNEESAELGSLLVGNELLVMNQSASVEHTTTSKKAKIVNCKECSTKNKLDNVFCIKCGAELVAK